MADTFFGKIARNQTDVELIHEDEICVAFADIAPQAPTHILVIPREPFESAVEADAETSGSCDENRRAIGPGTLPRTGFVW